MSGEKQQGQWEIIERAIEDAERIIYFASQGRIDEVIDLECLQKLTNSFVIIKQAAHLKDVDPKEIANFLRQLSLMSHIIYPVTAESLMVMDGMAFQPCANGHSQGPPCSCINHIKNIACSSPALILLAVFAITIGMIITPYVFSLSLTGSNIIGRLDATLKERVALKADLIAKGNNYVAKILSAKGAAESSADAPKAPANEVIDIIDVVRSLQINSLALSRLALQLEAWNNSGLGQTLLNRFGPPAPPGGNGKDGNCNDHSKLTLWEKLIKLPGTVNDDLYAVIQEQIASLPPRELMEKNLTIKNNGLVILQALNSCLLLLLFGCCGASAYVLRKTVHEIQSHTFTGIRWATWIRILLGTFSGFFLGYLAGNNDLTNLLSAEGGAVGADPVEISLISPLTLAFAGGYSVDLLYSILNRFIYAITNDERYLPANELMKRKVDVTKFIYKGDNPAPPETPRDEGTPKPEKEQ